MATIASDKMVLVDTSVWIDYFRKNEEVYDKLNRLIDQGRVCCARLIVAELIQGAKERKEVEVIKNLLDVFPILEEREDTWFRAGVLSYNIRRKGKEVGLADCYLAIMATDSKSVVCTFDQHFKVITKFLPKMRLKETLVSG